MKISRMLAYSALGVAGVMLTVAASEAQSAAQVVQVPPGFTAVLVPDNSAPVAMPDPFAMLRQADAMMAQMQAQQAAMMQAAFGNTPFPANGAAGEVITVVSDGTHSCTQQITYPGNGAKLQMTSTGNGCAMQGVSAPALPAALPNVTVPKQTPAVPLVVAERQNEQG